MLRLLLQSSFRLSIVLDHSCATPLRLLHDKILKNLRPSVSDATVSYLLGSYGLSPTAALSVAKKFTFKTTDAADSLLSLLKSHGFTQLQIAHIGTTFPVLLTYNSEKKIKPKLEFFLNVGYSSGDITKIVTSNPHILAYSLENRLRPNLKILRDSGVPQHIILKMIASYPRAMMKSPSRFKKAVGFLQKIGFDVSNTMFLGGMNALYVLSQSLWDKKLELYKSLGWSEEETLTAFRKYPYCMSLSQEKIKRKMAFYVENVKFEPSYLARRPDLLAFSVEKRVSPRYKTFCLLESKGLKTTMNFSSLLKVTENEFINIIKNVNKVPEVHEVCEGKEDQ